MTESRFVNDLFAQRNDQSSLANWRSATAIRFQFSKFKIRLHQDMKSMDAKLEDLHKTLLAAGPRRPGSGQASGGLRPPIPTMPVPKSSPREKRQSRPLAFTGGSRVSRTYLHGEVQRMMDEE